MSAQVLHEDTQLSIGDDTRVDTIDMVDIAEVLACLGDGGRIRFVAAPEFITLVEAGAIIGDRSAKFVAAHLDRNRAAGAPRIIDIDGSGTRVGQRLLVRREWIDWIASLGRRGIDVDTAGKRNTTIVPEDLLPPSQRPSIRKGT